MKKFLTIIGLAAVTLAGAQAQVIARWTFETSIPTTSGPLSPEVGAGTATSNTGGTFSNPAGWGSAESWSSNGWAAGEFFQFEVSTVARSNIAVSWQQAGSNTGPRDFILEYSTDGVSFTNFASYAVNLNTWNGTLAPAADVYSYDLSSITALNNDASIFFRLNVTGTTAINLGTIAGAGTGRVDNFEVSAIPEPSTWALIGLGSAFMLWNIRRRRTANG